MSNKHYLIAALGGLIVTTLTVSLAVSAAPTNDLNQPELKQHMREEQQLMRQIMEDQDYGAWSQRMSELADKLRIHADQIDASINEQTFDILLEAYELKQNGQYEEALQLLKENNVELGFGPVKAFKHGFRAGKRAGQIAN